MFSIKDVEFIGHTVYPSDGYGQGLCSFICYSQTASLEMMLLHKILAPNYKIIKSEDGDFSPEGRCDLIVHTDLPWVKYLEAQTGTIRALLNQEPDMQ